MTQVSYVQFRDSINVGPDQYAATYLAGGQIMSSYRVSLSLSPDNLFVVVRGQHTEKPAVRYVQLVPTLNVATVTPETDPYAPKQAMASSATATASIKGK